MKTVVLKVRLEPEKAERWRTAAVQAGAKDLSTFIRETVDERISSAIPPIITAVPLGEVTQPVECGSETPEVAGSIPALPMRGGAEAAQGPHKPKVEGSSPSPAIAEVAEQADAPDSSPGSLGSEGSTPSLGTSERGGVEVAHQGNSSPDDAGSIPAPASCPRKFTHKAGVYCTACGHTPA